VIATALHQTRNFGKENYDTLITKCAQHGSKLLRKPDQCRAVYLASHLWWATPNTGNGETEETEVRLNPASLLFMDTDQHSSIVMANVFLSVYSVLCA
jgi:hypothetical protein